MRSRSGLSIMMRLSGLIRPLAGYMVLAVLMGLVGNLCASFITVFGGYAALSVLGADIPMSLTFIFVSVVVFALVRGFLRYAEQSCNHFIAFKLLALIRDRVFRALRRLCPAKLEGKDKGDLISVITSDIELLEVFYAHTISPILIAILFCAVMCVFVFQYSIVLSLIALAAYVTVGLVIPVLTSRLCGDEGLKFRTKSGELSAYVLDSLRGLSETLQFNCQQSRLSSMQNMTDELSDREAKLKRVAGKNTAVTNTVIWFFDVLMLFVSATLYTKGQIGIDGVIISTVALMSSFGPCVALAALGSTLQNTFAAGNRVLDILDESPEVEEITEGKNVSFEGASARNVHFAYGDQKILDGVSMNIERGEIIGIKGRSGSGKSTLLKLFMRFWQTKEGSIEISDTNVNSINTDNLRDMESFVTQSTHLFHDSIKNNLKIARLDATDEQLYQACKKAAVHDFIMSLPNGYDTEVAELGDSLSGGERQRIGLARAFLHDSPLMMLDEPTSNLDSLSEAVILRAIIDECENKTVMLVSHRESTMRITDRVYSVEHGRIS